MKYHRRLSPVSIVRPRPGGGCEVTHFEQIRAVKRGEKLQRLEHVADDSERVPCALAIAKFIVPNDPEAAIERLPIEDEAGLVEALDDRDEVFQISTHAAQAARRDAARQPFSRR